MTASQKEAFESLNACVHLPLHACCKAMLTWQGCEQCVVLVLQLGKRVKKEFQIFEKSSHGLFVNRPYSLSKFDFLDRLLVMSINL